MSTDDQSNRQSSENEAEDTVPVENRTCSRCSAALQPTTVNTGPNRQLVSGVCRDCGYDAAAVLVQKGPLGDLCKSNLDSHRDSAEFGLTVQRVAAYVTEGCPSGTYDIQRLDEHTYSITFPKSASKSAVQQVGDRISSAVDHLTVATGKRTLAVTDTRLADKRDHADLKTDGGTSLTVSNPPQQLPPVRETDPARVKRAKRENMDVTLAKKGGIYEVNSESGNRYIVDLLEGTCSCPDTVEQCKHLRRVSIELNRHRIPRPDGRLP